MILKTLLILTICWVYRINPDYYYSSVAAWLLFVYALVWLDTEKPWGHIYYKWTADSCLFSYLVLVYLAIFHGVVGFGL